MNIFAKSIIAAAMLLPAFIGADAAEGAVTITNPSLSRQGNLLSAQMEIGLDALHVKSSEGVVFTPMVINGTDTLELPTFSVYGRTRWYQWERSGRTASGDPERILRYSKDMKPEYYRAIVDYQDWMNGSELVLRRTDYGCARCLEGEMQVEDLAIYKVVKYEPVFVYEPEVSITETVKTREISGRAYVDFPVNKIVIYPDYRNNTYELGKIIATIDSVKNDKDITVTSLHIAGTASPEGPYDNNVYLAKNRTQALKEYVRTLYNFPEGFITTSYEPVDWAGLREWLENNNIEHKDEILAIVNSDIEPFKRNSKIKTDFPTQYQWLLTNVYPSLRHSDYRIEYNIRQFTDIAEIAELIKTAPQKLSLSEMYLLANSLEPGSDEYNDVFEVAVRLFPDDERSNLNAAMSAMQRNDLVSAKRYLAKAGNTAGAVYARGVFAALNSDYATAIPLVEEAISMGFQDNKGILENLREAAQFAQ